MLHTERNSKSVERRVRAAFRASVHYDGGFDAVFEHGQWWISCKSGAQFSVVDAEGGPAIDSFDFEQVSEACE